MTDQPKIPLSAVMMSATHIYLERVKTGDMLHRDLQRIVPGSKRTYSELLAGFAAADAWKLAQAVEDSNPAYAAGP